MRHYRRHAFLGDTENGQVGSQVGSLVSSLTGIPGLGQAFGMIAGLFGPQAHYTPGGMLYDQAAETLKSQAEELTSLTNELLTREGKPNIPVQNWTMTSADDPITGPYLANLLGNPAYASATSPTPLIALQASGVYDAAIKVQTTLISAIENELNDPAPVGTSYAATQNGGVVPPPAPGSYQDVTVNGQTYLEPTNAAATGATAATSAAASGTSGIMAWAQANPIPAFGGAFLLLLLLTKR